MNYSGLKKMIAIAISSDSEKNRLNIKQKQPHKSRYWILRWVLFDAVINVDDIDIKCDGA